MYGTGRASCAFHGGVRLLAGKIYGLGEKGRAIGGGGLREAGLGGPRNERFRDEASLTPQLLCGTHYVGHLTSQPIWP